MILKICGITEEDDALAAIEAGANAIGFNFYPRSPRYMAPEDAAEIVTPPEVRRVGIFVNQSAARVESIAQAAHLDTAQLHGDEAPEDYPSGLAVWKAARVGSAFDWSAWKDCPAEAVVMDGPAAELYGGSGRTFDWSLAAVTGGRIILAGGLNSSNVARAIAIARPWGVDACSSFERAPGKKDHAKMREYIKAALEAFGK